jgi:putative NADPH-quinone reductase
MTSSSQILIIYAHPAQHQSRANRKLVEAARTLPWVLVRDLYETYPDFYIDVTREQGLVAQSELVVFIHPMRWYGMPSLLKEWFDVVFTPGWAYGPGGGVLQGKGFLLAVTTGSPADAFRKGGTHGRPLHDFLAPYEQTAALCEMQWLAPHVFYGAKQADEEAVDTHVATFVHRLETFMHPALSMTTSGANPIITIESAAGHGK